jgi:hypothetical protein
MPYICSVYGSKRVRKDFFLHSHQE